VPPIEPEKRIAIPVAAGITRIFFRLGFMEASNVMEGLKLARREPELRGIDPQNISCYCRRVMVIRSAKASGMAVWRKSLFATAPRDIRVIPSPDRCNESPLVGSGVRKS